MGTLTTLRLELVVGKGHGSLNHPYSQGLTALLSDLLRHAHRILDLPAIELEAFQRLHVVLINIKF